MRQEGAVIMSHTLNHSKKVDSEACANVKLLKITISFTWKTCGYY